MAHILTNNWLSSTVVAESISVEEYERQGKFILLLHNILTPEEAQGLIAWTDEHSYEPALINIGNGRQVKMDNVRNNDRCIIDNVEFADTLWSRVEQCVDRSSSLYNANWSRTPKKAVGFNERLRFLRYDPGTYFAPHYDGTYVRGNELGRERAGKESYVSALLYLNEGYEGGATRFLNPLNNGEGKEVRISPGSLLLFQHDCFHEGALLQAGRKYVMRTDVMYSNSL